MPAGSPRPRPRPRPRRRRRVRRWYIFFIFFLSIGTLGASTAVGLLLGYIGSLPPIERLEEYNPEQVTIVKDPEGRVIGEFSSRRRTVAAPDEIPEIVKRAFLAIEDSRFHEHYGVDLRGVARAVRILLETGDAREGASTITMQLPRNIMDDQVSRARKMERKIQESLLAFQIERRYSKDQILSFYLNHIEFGNNAFGIVAAADTYFSKRLEQLTIAEAALLAAIPKSATIYNPFTRPERALERRNLVIGRMREVGWISEAEYELALASPLGTRRGRRLSNAFNSAHPYFIDGLYRDLQNPPYGFTEDEIRSRGLVVESTVEPRFQEIAQEELAKYLVEVEAMWAARSSERKSKEEISGPPRPGQVRLARIDSRPTTGTVQVSLEGYRGAVRYDHLPYFEPDAVLKPGRWLDVRVRSVQDAARVVELEPYDTKTIQGSVVILDARGGDVLALVGGADFRDSENDGQYNRAMLGGKPAGSTIKPLFFAAGLERGFTPATIIHDAPTSWPSGAGSYSPKNYERAFFGDTTLVRGLEKSRNVVTVKLFERTGIRNAIDQVVKFDYRDGDAEWRKRFQRNLSICLGTVDMTALEMTAAYLPFTNQGIGRRPNFFKRITDRQGRVVRLPDPGEAVVLDPVVAYQMIYMLRQAVTTGTASSYVGNHLKPPDYPPVCGKTGTTDANTNVWFVGFTPDIVMGVYIGFDVNRTMGPGMTGGRVAGPLWREIFKRIFPVRDSWTMEFEEPPGIERRRVVDPGSGFVYEGVPFARADRPRTTPPPRTSATPAVATPRGPAVDAGALERLSN